MLQHYIYEQIIYFSSVGFHIIPGIDKHLSKRTLNVYKRMSLQPEPLQTVTFSHPVLLSSSLYSAL